MRIFSARPNPLETSYRPSPPFDNPIFSPHWYVIDQPDRVVVRAHTRLPVSRLIVGTAVSVFFTAVVVAAIVFPSKSSFGVRLFSLVPLAIALSGIWCSVIVPLYRVGPEPTLIEFDRRTGRVLLPRAALELRIDQVRRIERVEFEVLPREGRSRGIRRIHTVLAYTDDGGDARFAFLFHAEFHKTCARIAEALNVRLLDINLGVVGPYAENAGPPPSR